ncbi:DUF1572 family protein [Negadavirga shengliensis]|uniref:DUF1572 family protein n=1 Tax=Negadavirga shengliensis TaxID=1389218 RepID=A0ABV9SVN3_9BACT
MPNPYLDSVLNLLLHYKTMAEKAMKQVPEEKLFWQHNQDSNSIATIVKHMWGNMRSRWTDFLASDGEKEWRERDAEFDNDLKDRGEVLEKWEEGWRITFEALRPLTASDLEKTVYIRNRKHTVVDAINTQLAHYASHIGQIIYLSKMLAEGPWESLSIPKRKSKT